MKKFLFGCCFFLFLLSSFAQKGWRDSEMEIKVFLNNQSEAKVLHDLHLSGDIHMNGGFALMYVVPDELERIKDSQLRYELLISDLNAYYNNFWNPANEQYHSYDQIISLMDSLATAFPGICKKIILGTSLQGRQIACLKISDNVDIDENEAEVAFDGGIHGDEIGGPENLIRFARDLCTGYGSNTQYTDLINSREIYIYPMVNPDGRVNMSRTNAHGVDCNRDFGYMWNGEGSSINPFSQIETRVMRDFMNAHPFSIHVTYHSGIEEVIFPWCYRASHAPDYNNFTYLSALYSSSSGYSNLPYLQSYADYPTNGELIDDSYGLNGPVSLTVEISYDKQPTDILGYYQKNITPMVNMIKNAGYGLEGLITDSITGKPVAAAIFIDNFYPVFSDTLVGDFHKFVLPGTYTLTVKANNYETRVISGVMVTSGTSTFTNVLMKPANGSHVAKVACVVIPDNNPADEANTPAVIGAADNVNYSLGRSGWIILDMLQPVLNINGNDFKIYEGDATPEGYTCMVSQSMEGLWSNLGTGLGSKEFDLATLNSIRYIKIKDDGDGVANIADAGFDLDAVEVLGQVVGVNPEVNSIVPVIYPNPANNELNIGTKMNSAGCFELILSNMLGQYVFYIKTELKEFYRLNVSNLDEGIYLLTLKCDKGIFQQKIIVKHNK
ncbi:MAG: T9SS type A sorting domain-containing protein [Bacteroidetes bacterium]|nr:T9SS type A sorting domain-containing protein [Bacteroidota bacterium]